MFVPGGGNEGGKGDQTQSKKTVIVVPAKDRGIPTGIAAENTRMPLSSEVRDFSQSEQREYAYN